MSLLKTALCGLLGVAVIPGLANRAAAQMVVEERPARETYHFRYYPEAQVYFVPDQRVYWWREGGEWRSGPRSPGGVELRREGGLGLE